MKYLWQIKCSEMLYLQKVVKRICNRYFGDYSFAAKPPKVSRLSINKYIKEEVN